MKMDWKKFTIVIGIIIATSIIIGGTLWYSLSSAVDEQKTQITSLEKQASELSDIYSKKFEEKKAAEAAAAKKAAENKAKEQATTPTYTPSDPEPKPTPVVTPKIYYFYSPECGTCNAQTPIVNELKAEGVPFVFMNILAHPNYISQYGISAVPTFLLNGHKQAAYFTKPELLNFWNTYK